MKKISVLIMLCITFSCKKERVVEQEETINPEAINIITGIKIVNDLSREMGYFGNPNVLLQNNSKISSRYITDDVVEEPNQNNDLMSFYPNPSRTNIFNIRSSESRIKSIWILKGKINKSFFEVNFNELLHNTLYTVEEIQEKSVFSLKDLNDNSTKVKLSGLEKGFYRVFVQLQDGTITWNNIFVGFSGDYNELDVF